jgi:hypothetical protein
MAIIIGGIFGGLVAATIVGGIVYNIVKKGEDLSDGKEDTTDIRSTAYCLNTIENDLTSPIKKTTKNSHKDQDKIPECTICLQPNAIFKTACEHFFHVGCLLEWAKVKSTCPTCGTSLK